MGKLRYSFSDCCIMRELLLGSYASFLHVPIVYSIYKCPLKIGASICFLEKRLENSPTLCIESQLAIFLSTEYLHRSPCLFALLSVRLCVGSAPWVFGTDMCKGIARCK